MKCSKRIITALACSLMALSSISITAKDYYSVELANEILQQDYITQQLAHFKVNQVAASRMSQLNSWIVDQSLGALVQEKLLYQATVILRQTSLAPKEAFLYRATLEKLLSYQSQAYLPLEDGGHKMQVAAFEVAASAQATLIHWRIEAHFVHSSQLINQAPEMFLTEISQASQPREKQLGFIKAINQAAHVKLLSLRNSLLQQPLVIPTTVLNALAIKTLDTDLYLLLVEQATNEHQALVLTSLGSLPPSLKPEQQLEILMAASNNQNLANGAITALADFVDDSVEVRHFLNNALSDIKNGGAAAKALSKSKDSLTLELLAANLKQSNSLKLRRSLLALYLNNSFEANKYLLEFRDSTEDVQLQREVSEWLK